MHTDEHLIADLASCLRRALSYILADAGLDEADGEVGMLMAEHTGVKRLFNGDAARDLLNAASSRLATTQSRPRGLDLRFTPDRAAILSEGMSDLLCWCAGFSAAISDEPARHPYGVEAVRIVREELRAAVLAARGLQDEELPF